MNFFAKKRKKHVSEGDEVVKCKECWEDKAVLWDCAWDASHLICSDCAASCSRCGKYYCDDCRLVMVFCDSCDATFCPDCKPRVCVCIIPRAATCFMVNFKKKTYQDVMEEESRKKKAKRQTSDSTASTNKESAESKETELVPIESFNN